MQTHASPSVAKIALGVAAGIILAAVVIVFGLTGIGAAAQRHDAEKRAAEWQVVADCRPAAIRRAHSMDEALRLSAPCDIIEEAYRQKWGSLQP